LKRKRMHAHCFGHISGKFRVAFVWLILVTVVAGCTGFKATGLYEPMSSQEKKKVLEELKKNWQDYNVYCDGPISTPGAVIFDPKNDDRNLIGYRYNKLSKEESVRTAIVWIEFQLNYYPVLYRIFDEEKNFYGYVLIARDLPAPKRVDQKTLELRSFESGFHVP
jgi:hypothetical protein